MNNLHTCWQCSRYKATIMTHGDKKSGQSYNVNTSHISINATA